MPSRPSPKAYHLLLKTHKLTVFFTVHPSSTVAQLKEEAFLALTSDVLSSPSGAPRIPASPDEDINMLDEEDAPLPSMQWMEDFELCRAVKDKGKSTAGSSVSYETLDPSMAIKGVLSNWETIYVQFRDEDGTLLPVHVSQPPLLEEEDEEPRRAPPVQETPIATNKGKRKAPPE